MKPLARHGTKRWKLEMLKALKNPNYKIELSEPCKNLDQLFERTKAGEALFNKAQRFLIEQIEETEK